MLKRFTSETLLLLSRNWNLFFLRGNWNLICLFCLPSLLTIGSYLFVIFLVQQIKNVLYLSFFSLTKDLRFLEHVYICIYNSRESESRLPANDLKKRLPLTKSKTGRFLRESEPLPNPKSKVNMFRSHYKKPN
jgi:hypothetical protein